MGKKKNKKNKTDTTVSSTDEDKEEEIVKETSVIEFECPVCRKIPTNFKLSKNDKKMNIDKTKDSINLETDVHNITFKWGRHASPSDNGDNEAQETIKQMMKI